MKFSGLFLNKILIAFSLLAPVFTSFFVIFYIIMVYNHKLSLYYSNTMIIGMVIAIPVAYLLSELFMKKEKKFFELSLIKILLTSIFLLLIISFLRSIPINWECNSYIKEFIPIFGHKALGLNKYIPKNSNFSLEVGTKKTTEKIIYALTPCQSGSYTIFAVRLIFSVSYILFSYILSCWFEYLVKKVFKNIILLVSA